jgi:dTDP-L-rhamnose 4-epimerase
VRVLITGGAGFIGSHTADLLRAHGHAVRIVDGLLPPVHPDGGLPEYLSGPEVDFRRGDVRDKGLWQQALQDIDVVFHLAAYQDYLPDFSTFFHTNTVSTALLYEVAVERRLPLRKVIVASSQAVYGEGRYRCRQAECAAGGGPCYPPARDEAALARREWEVRCPRCGASMQPEWTDEAVVNPHNPYAISKHTQELVALNLGRRYGIPTVAMRYSIVQGPRQSFRNAYSGVLRIFTQRLLNGRPPLCYEDGEQLRDYVSVFDVARANVLVMEDPRADFLALNVGGDRRISVRAYAELIARRLGMEVAPQVPGLYRVGDTRHIFSDTSRLKALGWRPEVSLEEIVDGYVAWARVQPGFRDYSGEAEARMATLGAVRRVM